MFVTRNGSHQQDVGLLVAVLGEVDPFGFFLDLVGPAVLRSQGEAIRKHHNSAHLQAHIATVRTDLLQAFFVRNLDAGGEDAVGEDRLGNFSLGQLFGQVAVGANNLAGGFPGAVVVLLSPEGIRPAGSRSDQESQSDDQRSKEEREVTTHGTVRGCRRREGKDQAHQGLSPVRKSVSVHWLTNTLSFSTLTFARARERGAGPRTTLPVASY